MERVRLRGCDRSRAEQLHAVKILPRRTLSIRPNCGVLGAYPLARS